MNSTLRIVNKAARIVTTIGLVWMMLLAIGIFSDTQKVVAQLPQTYIGISVNDFAVKDDSTGDTLFVITDNTDSDTSIIYNAFLWEGLTLQCYSDAPHTDSAGINVYVEGSIRGGDANYVVVDSVNVTADATPTFGTTDLRAGRYRYVRLRIEGMASTDSSLVANFRLFRWGTK